MSVSDRKPPRPSLRRGRAADLPSLLYLFLRLPLYHLELTPASICFRDAQIFELIIDPIRRPLVPDEHHHPAIPLDPGVRQANGGFEQIILVLATRPGGPYGQL
jgi:hypothetical protein